MSQHDQVIANADGATVRADINDALAAIFSNSSGTTAPGATLAHQFWMDTTGNVWKKRNAANSGWIVVRSLDETTVLSRSSNTILGLSDIGKCIVATSTFTQAFTAAATLGDGWFADYLNGGSGVITLDPNSSETINGQTTLKLNPGESCRIHCNGSALTTIGLTRRAFFQANKNATDQTGVASATETKLTFTTEEFDVGGHYDAANSKLIPTMPGKWRITAQYLTTVDNIVDQSFILCRIYKNGVLLKTSGTYTNGTGQQFSNPVDAIIDFNGSTDYVEIYAFIDGAGDKTIDGAINATYFSGEYLGPY